MAQAAVPLMVAGAVVKTVGGLSAARANAATLRAQASEEEQLGAAQVTQIRANARAAMGRQVAGFAESGFAPGIGSASDALEESLMQRELDVMTTRRNASGKAAGLRSQAKMTMRKGVFDAIGTGISAASTIAGYKADYSAAGEQIGG